MSKILIIDDNELIRKLLQESLQENGYEVAVAMDANEGYSAALEVLPDLILLDVQLPDIAGFDLCRVIKNRAELRDLPIIMITGTARSTDEKVKGFQMGVDDYILKPFEISELIERIRAVLRRSEERAPRRMAESPKLSKIAPDSASELEPKPEPELELPRPSLWDAFRATLLAPHHLHSPAIFPPVSMAFLGIALGLCYLGAFAAANLPVKPALIGVGAVGLWGVLGMAALVMSSTLMGVTMGWKDGAALISLAASPILLKLCGALISSVWTTLSPFYFSASPALFWSAAPSWVSRLDLFELWAAALVAILVAKKPNSSAAKARVIAAIVWAAGAAFALGLGKL